MRIALVVSGGVDRSGRGRVIPVLLWLIERLAREHDVVVYALRYHRSPCSYPLAGATIHDLGSPTGIPRQAAALIRRLRRDGPFDVVHGHWAMPAGLVAALAGRSLGLPSVVTIDSGELVAVDDVAYGLQRTWRSRAGVAATLRLASRLVVCTTYMKQLAAAHHASPAVVPLGVDRTIFQKRGEEIGDGPPWRLVHVASLNPVKDQRTLIDALRIVVDEVGDVRLAIAGEDTMQGRIQALVRERQLEQQVTFHGFVPSDELPPLYRDAHLAVLSSRHEAAGVVVLEAAACGVATVGSAVGYLADWTPDRAAAVPAANAPALARAIVELIRDPSRRHRLAMAACEWTAAHDADWTARAFTRIYGEVVRR